MMKSSFIVVVMVAAAWGCGTTVEVAPVVEQALEVQGVEFNLLERGRRVYLSDCAQCHRPEPITRYSGAAWAEILPRMVKEAKLSQEDTEAVMSYVRWVLQATRRKTREVDSSPHSGADSSGTPD